MARRFRASFGGDRAGRAAKILEPAAQLNVQAVGPTQMPAKKIQLDSRWERVLNASAEAGMGYWIATIRLASGEVFSHAVIDSGFVVDVPGYAGIPFTSEQITSIEVTNDKAKYARRVLTRYWFPLPKHIGIGVTAASISEAREMAERVAAEFHWPQPEAVVENVDIRSLDQNHVIPNIGPVSVRGVWYPALNL